jgi:hypothetical protein
MYVVAMRCFFYSYVTYTAWQRERLAQSGMGVQDKQTRPSLTDKNTPKKRQEKCGDSPMMQENNDPTKKQ